MIPREIIDKLNELPILSVASKLEISVKGKRALCFMHNDSHPSLHFNTDKNTWKCYVCNKGGAVINLVMEKLEIGFVDACKWLADQFTIVIPEDDGYRKQFKKKTVKPAVKQKVEQQIVTDIELYEWIVRRAILSEQARQFLFEERKYSEEVVRELGIGSVTYPNKLVDALVNRFGEERCIKSGIVKRGQYGLYLHFYTPCLLFPYKDIEGRVVNLQSRYLGTKKEVPRFQFIQSALINMFNIGVLKELKQGEKLFLSEGITDCIALLSSGRKAVAIPSATLLKEKQLTLDEDLKKLENG
jgi:DNA primase